MFYLNRKASKRLSEQQSIIEKNKILTSIFVIDKKREKAENVNLPKAVMEQMPKIFKVRKAYFVKAKAGPQILTLMCDKKIFNDLPVKKNIKVELVGIYIYSIKSSKPVSLEKVQKKEKKSFTSKLKGRFTKKANEG